MFEVELKKTLFALYGKLSLDGNLREELAEKAELSPEEMMAAVKSAMPQKCRSCDHPAVVGPYCSQCN